MKIIFLDIDGVLNSEDWYEYRFCKYTLNKIEVSHPMLEFDPKAIMALNKITDETKSNIIISSSWRHGKTLNELCMLFEAVGITGHVIGMTDDFAYNQLNNGKEIIDYRIPRGCEIDHWLEQICGPLENYIILDDDMDMLYSQKDNFIHIDARYGLTDDIALEAIKILNNPNNK